MVHGPHQWLRFLVIHARFAEDRSAVARSMQPARKALMEPRGLTLFAVVVEVDSYRLLHDNVEERSSKGHKDAGVKQVGGRVPGQGYHQSCTEDLHKETDERPNEKLVDHSRVLARRSERSRH